MAQLLKRTLDSLVGPPPSGKPGKEVGHVQLEAAPVPFESRQSALESNDRFTAAVSVEEGLGTPFEVARVRTRAARTRGYLGAGITSQLNLMFDLLALIGALTYGPRLLGIELPSDGGILAALPHALFAALVWAIAATAVRHYRSSAYQAVFLDDAAMTSVVLVAVFTALVVSNRFFRAIGNQPADLRILLLDLVVALSLRPIFRQLLRREVPSEEVLIVGGGTRGRLVAESIERTNNATVLGMIRFEGEAADEQSLPVLGRFADLETILRTTPVSNVYVAGNVLKDAVGMQDAITICERLGIPFALPAYSFRLGRALPADAQRLQHGYVHYNIYEPKVRRRAVKRVFDIISSAAALWLLLPMMAVVAVAIKLNSRGPIFFKQRRLGLHGRSFNMLKFRSMIVDAEALKARLAALNEQTGPVFKMRNDPRVTAVGRFIRKYSIDELPQLINVLRGDMSVVGPRPPVPSEVVKYEAWQQRRLSVRPGLTCLWQVSGRNQISFEEWMYLDMQYIDHWSLLQDLRLIFRTVPVVFTGRGSS